jgi:mono/diheme cytochrome c family protein
MMGMLVLALASRAFAEPPSATLARGRYLAEGVAFCGDCHTPLDDSGKPDRARWLHGSSVGFRPLEPVPDWPEVAPALAGAPGYTPSELVRFLMTGITAKGKISRPPMPAYRLHREDAQAIAAYLRSLPPALESQYEKPRGPSGK